MVQLWMYCGILHSSDFFRPTQNAPGHIRANVMHSQPQNDFSIWKRSLVHWQVRAGPLSRMATNSKGAAMSDPCKRTELSESCLPRLRCLF
uniref:Uncharacterized protein n=1 Tax=Anguilla anguilla TaxID=7936 RepID=A0A0E9XCI1_ANGAN